MSHGTRHFTYNAATGDLVEFAERDIDHTHPLGPSGSWGVCPGVAMSDSEEDLDEAIRLAVVEMRQYDPLAIGDVVHVTAHCQHIRREVLNSAGWNEPVMLKLLRERPTGWLVVAMMPSLRISR